MHVEWLNENYAHYKIRNYLSTEKARFIVCIVVLTSPPLKKNNTTHLFFAKPPFPLRSANCPSSPLFRQFPPIYVGFSWMPPKNQSFQWTLLILKFFIFNPIPSFKSN